MIRGRVDARLDATIAVALLVDGRQHVIEAVIDTGFNGFLTLTSEVIRNLKLPFLSYGHARLADGTEQLLATYSATVVWDRAKREIEVLRTAAHPLVGMSLLQGYQLDIHVIPGGRLTIKRLTPTRPRKKSKRR